MSVEKLSVSLPHSLVQLVVLRSLMALERLQSLELEDAYREAAQEVNSDWELTVADGLSDETW
jgi:hypothetical protein